MKDCEAIKLFKGDQVRHKRYGAATVREVLTCDGSLFGVVISPSTQEGKRLLAQDSIFTQAADFLEDNAGQLTCPTDH
jgi:hypothetical protein